ncbi:acyl carrier protein [Pendulispora rubella]
MDRNKHFKAMGMDSLLSIDLLTTLEGFFGPISETAIEQYPTIAKLANHLCETRAQKSS